MFLHATFVDGQPPRDPIAADNAELEAPASLSRLQAFGKRLMTKSISFLQYGHFKDGLADFLSMQTCVPKSFVLVDSILLCTLSCL